MIYQYVIYFVDILWKYVINSYNCFRISYENEWGHFEGFREVILSDKDPSQISSDFEAENDIAPENIVSGRNLGCEEDLCD